MLVNAQDAGILTEATICAFAKDAGLTPDEDVLARVIAALLADIRLFCEQQGIDFGSLVAQGGEPCYG